MDDKASSNIQNYSNYFISFCIQNNIPIDIVSQRMDLFKERLSNELITSCDVIENIFLTCLPPKISKIYNRKAMIMGKTLKDVIFTDF